MQFIFDQSQYDKDALDTITQMAIEHCTKDHCTCDAQVDLQPAGLLIEGDNMAEIIGVVVIHTKLCYASGRRN